MEPEFEITDAEITAAFDALERQKLKDKMKDWDKQVVNESSFPKKGNTIIIGRNPKIIYLFRVFSYLSAAACLLFFWWNFQKPSDNELFNEYLSGSDKLTASIDIKKINYSNNNDITIRGQEDSFENLSSEERLIVLKGIELINVRNFESAKKIFYELGISKEQHSNLLIFLAVAQLNTNGVDSAIANLENLNGKKPDDDVKYYLALGYLKLNKTSEAKKLLKELRGTKLQSKADYLLKNMRLLN